MSYTTSGSVRRAREAAEARRNGRAVPEPSPLIIQKDGLPVPDHHNRQPRQAPLTSRDPNQSIGGAVSHKPQTPQWPLTTPSTQHAGALRQAPPRPSRPNDVPSIISQTWVDQPATKKPETSQPSDTIGDLPDLLPPSHQKNPRDSISSSIYSVPDLAASIPAVAAAEAVAEAQASPYMPPPLFSIPPPPPPHSRHPQTLIRNFHPPVGAPFVAPPSARRGPPSYYHGMALVSPIYEEPSPRYLHQQPEHHSYASSGAMPTSPTDRTDPADPTDGRWQDEDVFVEGEEDGYYERLVETAGHEREQGHEHDAYGKGGDIAMEKERWRGHDMDLDRDTDENVIALVRSASIGRRIGKPTLTLVRTSSHRSSSSGEKKPQPQPQPSGGRSSVDSSLGTAYIGPRPVPKPVQTAEQVLLGGVIVNGAGGGFRDHSDDSETLPQLPRLQDRDGVGLHHDADAATRTRIASDGEEAERARRIGAIRDREAQRAAMRGQYRQSSWPETGDADQQISVLCPGGPPRVRDPDDPEGATRERASLTSLPDLIRRATRLAGMIDRGKRPASRIDALDVSSSEDISGAGKEAGAGGRLTGETMRTGRISPGILNAFPVPLTSASGTNTRSGTARTGTGGGGGGRGGFTKRGVGVQVGEKGYWTGDAGDRGDRDRATKRGKRRCGLPTRWFLLALLLVILLIAAAIFVPLYFTVFRHRSSSSTSSSGTASAPFNGTSIPTDGDSVACTSLAIHGTTYSYKVGYAILRLLEQGPGNFSIPLDAATVVERFGAAGASCGVMNALVSFNGTNGATADSGGGGGGGSAAGAAGRKRKRDGTTATTTTSEAPIAVATGSPIPSPATTAGSGSGSATGGGTASASGAGFVLNSTHIDFARVALLYILSANNTADETSPFGIAVQAQTSLQTWFYNVERFGVSGYGPGNVIVGGDHSVNFIDFEIDGVGGGYRATG